jgi:hypothetical protein
MRDQAEGLRRLFAQPRAQLVPVVASTLLACNDFLLDQLVGAYLERGLRVLVVDAGPHAKPAPELARVNLGACIETLSPQVRWLDARGLTARWLDTRGSAAALLPVLHDVALDADVILLHAPVAELARVLHDSPPCRPVLLADTAQTNVTAAYAAMKWLHQRAGLPVFALLLGAPPALALTRRIATQLSDTAERFLGAALPTWAAVDPRHGQRPPTSADLRRLARDALFLDPVNSGHHPALGSARASALVP